MVGFRRINSKICLFWSFIGFSGRLGSVFWSLIGFSGRLESVFWPFIGFSGRLGSVFWSLIGFSEYVESTILCRGSVSLMSGTSTYSLAPELDMAMVAVIISHAIIIVLLVLIFKTLHLFVMQI